MIIWWKDFIPVVWLLFGGGSPLCWDLPAPMSWLPWSRRSRRWLLSECKKISFQRHWWSCARVDMIRPGIQGSSHNIDPSDSTVLQENVILANTRASTTSKTSTRTTRKTKTNLLHYTGPLRHHLHHRVTKDCCSLTLGRCSDSWSWFVFWSWKLDFQGNLFRVGFEIRAIVFLSLVVNGCNWSVHGDWNDRSHDMDNWTVELWSHSWSVQQNL